MNKYQWRVRDAVSVHDRVMMSRGLPVRNPKRNLNLGSVVCLASPLFCCVCAVCCVGCHIRCTPADNWSKCQDNSLILTPSILVSVFDFMFRQAKDRYVRSVGREMCALYLQIRFLFVRKQHCRVLKPLIVSSEGGDAA